MTRLAVRTIAPVAAVALALLAGGCSSDGSSKVGDGALAGKASAASDKLCSAFASLKTDAADLGSTPIDSSATAEEIQQQVDALAGKADKVRDDLNTMMQESQGGPAAAVIGALNQKADALKAQLTVDKANAQADLGPKITAAQDELKAALAPVTAAVGKLCPSS